MRFSVRHVTRYEYSVPVVLGAHVLRLIPQGPNVQVHSHHLQIDPPPSSRVLQDDLHGNRVLALEFSSETQVFGVESAIEAETSLPPAPIDPGWPSLPWRWNGEPLPPVDTSVAEFAAHIAVQAGQEALLFLERLTRALFERTDRRIRFEGNAQTPAETLASRVGACRDLSVLFLECCRARGIGGRFVSGYQAAADTPDGQRHLHAWAEVDLPGCGVRGYDPTHGQPVDDGHLPLCRAPSQLETMPVEGGYHFLGSELTSTLTFSVQIATG